MIQYLLVNAGAYNTVKRVLPFLFSLFVFIFFCFSSTLKAGDAKIDSLLTVLSHSKEDTAKVKTLNDIGQELGNRGNYEGALKYAYEQKALAEKIAYKKGVAMACNAIGLAYYKKGDFSESLKNYSASLRVCEEIGDRQGIADCYNNMGLIYLDQGSYPEALKNYLQALRIYESLAVGKSTKKRIGSVYINIGSIYLYQANYSEALKDYFQALHIMEDIADKKGMADAYTNIGAIYYLRTDYEEALKNYMQSVKLKEEIGDQQGIADSYINIGLINHDQGNYEKALENYFRALKIFEEAGNKDGTSAAYISIGISLTKQKKFESAKKYLLAGLQLSKDMGAKDNLKECYSGLAHLSEATGDYKSAYTYDKLFSDIKDSLLSQDNSKQIAEIKIKYEMEKKDNQIALLNSENKVKEAELKKQKIIKYGAFLLFALFVLLALVFFNSLKIKNKAANIVQRNEIRKRISLDLHDEIGSGLTTISMICEQAEMKAESGEDDVSVSELSDKVKTQSRMVSQKLRELVWAMNPENDNLEVMLSYMRNYVFQYFDNSSIAYTLHLPGDKVMHNLEPDVSRNLIFVLKEALNNCIKHSEATEIEILFKINSNNNYTFKIADNGKGIDYNSLPLLHSGLNNMRKRIEDLNGKFNLISEKGKGTSIEIIGKLV